MRSLLYMVIEKEAVFGWAACFLPLFREPILTIHPPDYQARFSKTLLFTPLILYVHAGKIDVPVLKTVVDCFSSPLYVYFDSFTSLETLTSKLETTIDVYE
jgi:hypothetical protein